ncbi:hypothetical protein GCM10010145_25760 [Streptomyces ruber]|uniref:DUF397 domain-containing protein n=2 Tax=Streptomyces TaxID=1883 RepID=A0A918BB98_9ACTN|nr:DUF397 domain-containing protein [Streptomyces ruber]GGQ54974.1 hypothetical protein GCM10010145_25760 [Streptomyces ruber]
MAERTRWRKSSYSGPEAGSCLEVLDHHPTGIPVRDSKVPDGPALLFPPAPWASFVTAVKNGELPA